jgi:hypothetical protein
MTHEFAYASASDRGGSLEVGAPLAPYGRYAIRKARRRR